jgi:hypothetical protein
MEEKKEPVSWIQVLEPISKFIGTYGLAVFLVVYYAVWLYPDSFKERGAWITKIEELRRSINPEEKPLTSSQAECLLDYVTDLYFLNVQSELPLNNFSRFLPTGGIMSGGGGYYSGGSFSPEKKPKNSIEIFGAGFMFFIDSDKETKPQVEKIINDVKKSAKKNATNDVEKIYDPIFNQAISNALKSSSRLRLFNYETETLYELWTKTVSNNEEQFKKELIGSFIDSKVNEQYESLSEALLIRLNFRTEKLETYDYDRPTEVLDKYRKKMKEEWLKALRSENQDLRK